MNLLQGQIQCIECKSKKLIKDHKRQEVYCSKCGLVLVNNDIPGLNLIENSNHENQENQDKKQNRKLEKIQYVRMKNYFYNFF